MNNREIAYMKFLEQEQARYETTTTVLATLLIIVSLFWMLS